MFFGKGKVVVELVKKHLDAVSDCLSYYESAMIDILDGCSPETLEKHNTTLRGLESEADQWRHEIIRKMLDGGLLVDSRKSLMRIIEQVDKVANLTETISGKLYLEGFEIEPYMVDPIKKINKTTSDQYALLANVIKQVFYQYNVDELYVLIREIEDLESVVDRHQKALIKSLFDSDIDLAKKLHYKQLINKIASISDIIEDISDDIEIIMLSRKV